MLSIVNPQPEEKEEVTLLNFEQAFTFYYSLLYQYALSITKDECQAKDVVAEVFLQVWVKRHSLAITVSTKSYLLAMVRHQALRQVKSQKVSQQRSGDYLLTVAREEPGPLERFLSQETALYLEDLISQLPVLRQEIIELKLFGLKNREIAETLGLTEKKVEYQLGQAVETLRYQIRKSAQGGKIALEALSLVNIALMVS